MYKDNNKKKYIYHMNTIRINNSNHNQNHDHNHNNSHLQKIIIVKIAIIIK